MKLHLTISRDWARVAVVRQAVAYFVVAAFEDKVLERAPMVFDRPSR